MKKALATLSLAAFGASALFARYAAEPPSADLGTVPPDRYVLGYYAPPPDWVPWRPIADYTLNTRVPDLFWLKYEGAYAMALRVRPIAKAQVERDIEVKLIDPARAEKALAFSKEGERDAGGRTVGVFDLDLPADDFVEFSFKMRAKTKAPGDAVVVSADGVASISTAKDEDASTPCADGFRQYRVAFPAKEGRRLGAIRIVVPPAAEYDPDEEYVFLDLNLRRATPKARFTDLPRRRWIRKAVFDEGRPVTAADEILDVVAFAGEPSNGAEGIPLPTSGHELRPQADGDRDGGFQVEQTRVTIGGRECDAVRVTLEKGPRCYLKFPLPAVTDGRLYNTMTFYAKVEAPDGVDPRKLYRDTSPRLYGVDAETLNSFFDTFSFGAYSAKKDAVEWGRYGVLQGLEATHWQRGAQPGGGWRAVALDLENSDMAGNKSTYLPELTHWCLYYANAKIPEGKKVVVTVAAPRLSAGLMLAGGDLGKYREFLRAAREGRLLQKGLGQAGGAKWLGPPEKGRLDSPLPLVRAHVPLFEFVLPGPGAYAPAYRCIVERALDNVEAVLASKFGIAGRIARLERPSGDDNVKIFLGSGHFEKADPALCAADRKAMEGRAGCAIRTRGKSVYIYGGPFNYAGEARGIANGLYLFLENNTDLVVSQCQAPGQSAVEALPVFEVSASGDMDAVWGRDFLHVPPLRYWSLYGNEDFADRNLYFPDSWHLGRWKFGGRRQHTTNHWWGYGADENGSYNNPNERWGLGEDGQRMPPGCYTGHPCLVNVLEHAKAAYLDKAFKKTDDNAQCPPGEAYIYRQQDDFGLWTEDTQKICVCEKCLTPIRLADGSAVGPDDPCFRSAQFYANACAMINAVNVHARRDIRIESIGYLWMSAIPPFEISRNYQIRFCPYIRKDYFRPIFAPCNDLFWRDFHRWSQLDVEMGIYEYFLFIGTRPWADVFQFDFPEEVRRGLRYATPESNTTPLSLVEHWTLARYFWDPSADPRDLRRRYIRRAFREAGPAVEKFYGSLHNFIYEHFAFDQPTEFEDEQQVGTLALLTPSSSGSGTVAEELAGYLDEAKAAVRNPASARLLDALRADWDAYMEKARARAATLRQ